MHRLSNQEKREFYSGLARLLRSGASLPKAIDVLARDAPKRIAAFLRALNEHIDRGEPLGDALLQLRPKVSELEASIITAAGASGKLDRGCDQLARYFDALARSRSDMLSRIAYPAVMLVLTIFVVNIRYAISGGATAYLVAVIKPLILISALIGMIWILWQALIEAARHNVLADLLVRRVPVVGAVRDRFAYARFFATLDAQLESGLNVWDAFANAARTSDSARIINAAREAMPALRDGESLGEVLASKKVIPAEDMRAFRVAEQAGELDDELTQLALRSEERAVAALTRWSEWLPRMIYGGVLIYSAMQIFQWYQSYLNTVSSYDPFSN